MERPQINEYNPYFGKYIALVGEGDFFKVYHDNTMAVGHLFMSIPAHLHNYSYEPGKWDVKDVLMHIIDTERVMAYRALVAARGDSSSLLPSMDENGFADSAHQNVQIRQMETLVEEFLAVRRANQLLFANIGQKESHAIANVNGQPFTASAAGFIIIGHAMHHMGIVRERYLR